MADSHIVAVRGELQMLYEGKGDPKPNDIGEMCRIGYPDGRLSNPLPVQQVLKWGYWTPPPKEGEKAKGRWRTLKDGRRVLVTGTQSGVTGATWRNSAGTITRDGKLEMMRDEDRELSVSPDYLLHTGVDRVEADDVLGFSYMSVIVQDNVNRDAVDFNEELNRVGRTKALVVDSLADPTNEAFFTYLDRDGDTMVHNARLEQEGEFHSGRGSGIGANIVFTHSEESAGAGSGGLGGAKVFYAPYNGRSESLQEYMRFDGLQDLGFDPLFVTAHEVHHALGSHTELDIFSEVMATSVHFDLGNNLFTRNVDSTVYSMISTGRSRAVNRKDSPNWGNYVRKHRAATRWLYNNYPKQLRESFVRYAGGEQYAGDYWKTLEKKIKRWKTSYPEKKED